ncbi:MAG: hypothetical protein H6741_13840 [Alphaproteobacteria bacterium]|nr:hypothetical protein [Alphaproteobacteria bacterium]
MTRTAPRRNRRGVYALIAVLLVPVLMGFGALAVDISYLRLAQAQAQDIADAASQAALIALRQTGDQAQAEAIALAVCERNKVVGFEPNLDDITFGTWDEDTDSFGTDSAAINAVRVTVSRKESNNNAVDLHLGAFFGRPEADVTATATSASRNLHVCLAMDITNSWTRPNYYESRAAALLFLATMEGLYGEEDMIGMAVFSGRYGWEFSPMTLISDEVSNNALAQQWGDMETASKPGRPRNNANGCSVDFSRGFSNPQGGCFPDMPREYSDEPGTDHTTGMEMCRTMLEEQDDPTVFNAVVMLTDGYPNGTGSSHGNQRAAAGWTEPFREFQATVPHTTSEIQSESVQLAEDMYQDLDANIWVVSFVANPTFLQQMPQGQGYYLNTSDASDLEGIFADIAQSLPMAIVE